MYVKLIDNRIEYAPKNKGSILNYDLDVELMLADGYKPFEEIERPETSRLYHIGYKETDVISEIIIYDETEEEYEERIERQRKEQRNLEIDEKIKQLNEMALSDVLQNNKANIELYNEVINGLEQARPV